MKHFVKALKSLARARNDKRNTLRRYLDDNPAWEDEDVFRETCMDPGDLWFGYIYTVNNSRFTLNEQVKPKLEGMEIIWPHGQDENQAVDLCVGPSSDHIIIMRRNNPMCSLGMAYVTQPPEEGGSGARHISGPPEDKPGNMIRSRPV